MHVAVKMLDPMLGMFSALMNWISEKIAVSKNLSAMHQKKRGRREMYLE